MIEVEKSRPLLLPVLVFFFKHLQQGFIVGPGLMRPQVSGKPSLAQDQVQAARAHQKAHVKRGASAERLHRELFM